MKRRIPGLGSSVKAVKKKSWREEEDLPESESDGEKPPPPPEDESKPPKVAKKAASTKAKDAAGSEDELEMMLDAALQDDEKEGDFMEVAKAVEGEPNPIVWMDLSVAGKPRGRLHFELYKDIVPGTAENFRRLCLGATVGSRRVGYKGSELHKVMPGRLIEGGEFDCSSSGNDFPDESFKLTHTTGGLLSMCGAGKDANSSRFQILMRPSPELDNKQVVFGHVLPEGPGPVAGDRLHVLHWVEAVGTIRTGSTREVVVIEDCGQCSAEEAQKLLAAPRPPGSEEEPQESRYARAGLRPAKLADAVHRENLKDVLELTEDSLEGFEWEVKKAQRSSHSETQDRVKDVEACLKPLGAVLEEAKYKAGTVQGERGQTGRKAQSQQLRLKDLKESLDKLY